MLVDTAKLSTQFDTPSPSTTVPNLYASLGQFPALREWTTPATLLTSKLLKSLVASQQVSLCN